jgi:crossover junction endodeoxyribonuclease RuvC
MPNLRILGVDPALAVTGYGVIDVAQDKLALVEAGIVATSAAQLLPQRLHKIHKAIVDLISETEPTVMVLEKLYAHYRHPTTAYLLGQARGVICLVCAEKNIPLVEYPATRVKKAVVGQGLAGKYQVQRMVANILGIRKLPEYTDVTDALALAIAHSYIAKQEKTIAYEGV